MSLCTVYWKSLPQRERDKAEGKLHICKVRDIKR